MGAPSEFVELITRGSVIHMPKQPPKIIIARHVGSYPSSDSITLEEIQEEFQKAASPESEPFDRLLTRAWIVLQYIDGLQLIRREQTKYHRIMRCRTESEFEGAIICAKYSILLYNAAILVRDFPRGITASELVQAFEDYTNRMVSGGVAGRPMPFKFKAGWNERLSPFGYDLAWSATSVARSLVFAATVIAEHWLTVAQENSILGHLHDVPIQIGKVSANSHTVGTLASIASMGSMCAATLGREFFTDLGPMGNQEAMRSGWSVLLAQGLGELLPSIEPTKAFELTTSIRAEQRECLRRVHKLRKKQSKKTAQLPSAPRAEKSRLTIPDSWELSLSGRGNPVHLNGHEKAALNDPQYNVLQALIEAGAKGLNKDELVQKSGHSDARGILTRLSASDPDWKQVIVMPGKPGGRYRVRTSPH
jgi:hypothetical protein